MDCIKETLQFTEVIMGGLIFSTFDKINAWAVIVTGLFIFFSIRPNLRLYQLQKARRHSTINAIALEKESFRMIDVVINIISSSKLSI